MQFLTVNLAGFAGIYSGGSGRHRIRLERRYECYEYEYVGAVLA